MSAKSSIEIFDSTLRDGSQGEGISFSVQDKLKIAGILFTRHSSRTLIAREIIETMEQKAAELNVPILKSTIRDGVAVREAQTLRQSLFEYAPKSKPAKDYLDLLAEIGL